LKNQILYVIINSHFLPITFNKLDLYGDCCKAKTHILPFNPSSSIDTTHLHIVYLDLWGSFLIVFMNDFCYYVYFIDDFF
jgi:hypothetical protein